MHMQSYAHRARSKCLLKPGRLVSRKNIGNCNTTTSGRIRRLKATRGWSRYLPTRSLPGLGWKPCGRGAAPQMRPWRLRLRRLRWRLAPRTSYAGILTMLYYDAASKKVYSLNACYNTVLEEKDPFTIPKGDKPSGRTALVPGFFAGAQAAHNRFGKLPFASLFEPAIYLARLRYGSKKVDRYSQFYGAVLWNVL